MSQRSAPRLVLGTAQFGLTYGPAASRPLAPEVVSEILAAAWEGGIDTLDTAAAYGNAEQVIGEMRPPGAQFKVISKTVPVREASVSAAVADRVRDGVVASISRLRVKALDALLVHHAPDLLGPGGTVLFRRLETLRSDGLVGRLGVSVYDAPTLRAVLAAFPVEIVQLPINILNQTLLSGGMVTELERRGVEVHVRSVFLQGALLMDPAALAGRFAALGSHVVRFRSAAASAGLSPAAAALGFVASCAPGARIVIGVNTAAQLRDNILALAEGTTAPYALDTASYASEDADLIDPPEMVRVKHPIVYLPVEFRSREFDAKALLAARLAERGYPVVLGQQWMIFANLERLPAGVVLFKSFNRLHQPAMHVARRAGHRVVAMEEELLAQAEEKAVTTLCAEGIFDAVDLLLAQGGFEYDVLKRVGGPKVRVEMTGNGRIDLLKPAARSFYRGQVDDLQRRYGDFVLVNTNFSTVNSIWLSVEQVTETEVAAGFLNRGDAAAMKRWREFIAYEETNRNAMHAAIRELSRRRPAQPIVVRPHPGENLKGWEGVFADCRNVQVVREGSHVPWTLACRVLLHTSCTTGFEAFVAGKPALSLVPSRGWTSDSLLSNEVNPVFADPLQIVAAAERILDGGSAPSPSPARAPQHYVWNLGEDEGARRSAELLVAGLPVPAPLVLPALQNITREEALRVKFSMPAEECAETLRRICDSFRIPLQLRVDGLGDSLFLIAPPSVAPSIAVSPPKPDHAQLRAQIEGACQSGNFQKAYDAYRENFAEAQRHADLSFFAGVALHELGRHPLALQYLHNAALMAGGAVDANISHWLARTHHRLGELEMALGYAEQAYRQMPMQQAFFDHYKELALRLDRNVPEHWVVIGCSHVRYFRFMQMNQRRFFAGRVHLECYEFGGATAYGLGNPSSLAGALHATRQIRPRLAQADRIIVQFGEVDCRRAAWKAAAVSGRAIEDLIAESVVQLENYVRREVLPHNKSVLLLGAKPQIVGDEDFHKVAAADEERIIFKPLAERERVTGLFNAQSRRAAEQLGIDYADIHDVLSDEKSRRQFFKKVYWDGYTTDTHGNVDYFATLYYQRLQKFV